MDSDGSFVEAQSSVDWDQSIPSSQDAGTLSSSQMSELPAGPALAGLIHSEMRSPSSVGTEGLVAPPSSRRGRLVGKNFFLTYSRTAMMRSTLSLALQGLGPLVRMIVAQESHREVTWTGATIPTHLHALVCFEKKKDVTMSHFDVNGVHPNIQIPNARVGSIETSLVNLWNYCLKEDQTPVIIGSAPVGRKKSRGELCEEAFLLAETQGVPQAVQFLRKELPFEMAKQWAVIERSLTMCRQAATVAVSVPRPMTEFKLPRPLPEWTSLFLSGPTGSGKTQLARALLPKASVVRHRDQLRTCDFSDGVIFDDFDVAHWPHNAIIHLVDWEESSGIDVKHGHVVIPPHTKKIFTHNKPFHHWMPQNMDREQYRAVERRVCIYEIEVALF